MSDVPDDLLAVAPAGRDDLGAVVAGDALEQVERVGVVGVRRLVDDERGRGRIDGGELDVERSLTVEAGRRAAGAAVDGDVADRVGQAVAILEGADVAAEILLELDHGDGLPEAGAALPEHLVQAEDVGHRRRGVDALYVEAMALAVPQACGTVGVRLLGMGLRPRARGRGSRGPSRRARRARAGPAPTLSMSCCLVQPVQTDDAGDQSGQGGRDGRGRRVHQRRFLPRRLHRFDRRAERRFDRGDRAADRQQDTALERLPHGETFAAQHRGDLGHLGRGRPELGRELGRGQVVAVVG